MPDSPETPRPKPKMAQGRKAGERPPDDSWEIPRKLMSENEKLKLKKILEILNQERRKD